jgi:hypothetical protein
MPNVYRDITFPKIHVVDAPLSEDPISNNDIAETHEFILDETSYKAGMNETMIIYEEKLKHAINAFETHLNDERHQLKTMYEHIFEAYQSKCLTALFASVEECMLLSLNKETFSQDFLKQLFTHIHTSSALTVYLTGTEYDALSKYFSDFIALKESIPIQFKKNNALSKKDILIETADGEYHASIEYLIDSFKDNLLKKWHINE